MSISKHKKLKYIFFKLVQFRLQKLSIMDSKFRRYILRQGLTALKYLESFWPRHRLGYIIWIQETIPWETMTSIWASEMSFESWMTPKSLMFVFCINITFCGWTKYRNNKLLVSFLHHIILSNTNYPLLNWNAMKMT